MSSTRTCLGDVVAGVSRIGNSAMIYQHCAACGILLEEAVHAPSEPPSNGVCCSACLEEYPELPVTK